MAEKTTTTAKKTSTAKKAAALKKTAAVRKASSRKRTLVIVESPAKAKTIEHYLGSGFSL